MTITVRKELKWWDYNIAKSIKIVKRLRKRIFRATRENDMKKVRSLQKLMLRSTSNIFVSIRKVTQINKGKATAGIDNKVHLTPDERTELMKELIKYKAWKPKPAKRIYIPKKNGKLRPLGIPTITDRCIQAIVKNALEPYWEALFEPTSYGFRPARSCKDAMARLFISLKCPKGTWGTTLPKKQWIVEGDIKGCFDNIDHKMLIETIGNFPARKLIKQWLSSGYVNKNVFHETNQGAPQGGIISPLLANIALHGLEKHLGITYTEHRVKGRNTSWCNKTKRALVRYADDFVILCESKEDALKAKEETRLWLEKRGLELSAEKTKLTNIREGFELLGWNFRLYESSRGSAGYKLWIKPSHESVKSIRQNLKKCFNKHRGSELSVLIKDANAIIRGWCGYHNSTAGKEIFSKIDKWLFFMQMKWIKRRTPRLCPRKRRIKYWGKFNPSREDKWVFGDKKTGTYMLKLAWTPIQRHPLITYNYSPDNPKLKEYWDKRNRKVSKVKAQNENAKFYSNILKKQKYVCPVCKDNLVFTDEQRHIHHIIPRVRGGGNHPSNLRILHMSCHKKIHGTKQMSPESLKILGITEKEYAKIERMNESWWKKQGNDKKQTNDIILLE